MKKILILLLSLLPVITFTACDDKDDIRKDIDELNARLDALTDNLESLNTSIKSFQEAMQGIVLITEYSMDEKGNYTLKMSDGMELTVYSGLPDEDIPVLGVSEDGYWTYTLNGETIKLSSKAKKTEKTVKRRRSQLMKRAIGVIPLQVAKHSVSEDLITLRILQRFPEVYLRMWWLRIM